MLNPTFLKKKLNPVFSDIVTEKSNFEIESFIPVLRERMYAKDRSKLIKNSLKNVIRGQNF